MCILGNMHGCFYGLWSKNNEYRVTIELVQKNSLHKKENPENLPEHFSENVIKAGAMNRNSWKSKNTWSCKRNIPNWKSPKNSPDFSALFYGKLVRSRTDGRLLTTKPDSKNHGLGLRNIEVCAEKYYGKTEVTVREDEFELAVMLQERIE